MLHETGKMPRISFSHSILCISPLPVDDEIDEVYALDLQDAIVKGVTARHDGCDPVYALCLCLSPLWQSVDYCHALFRLF